MKVIKLEVWRCLHGKLGDSDVVLVHDLNCDEADGSISPWYIGATKGWIQRDSMIQNPNEDFICLYIYIYTHGVNWIIGRQS